MHRRQISLVAVLIATAVLAACQRFEPPAGLDKIEHIVVIYLENRSFDNLYGLFPGANGVANAGSAAIQVDKDGKPYRTLPPPIDTHVRPHAVDPRFPADLPNAPFRIDAYVPPNEMTGSPVHRFYQQQAQINGGRMDKFVAFTDVGGLVMGYYDTSRTALWDYARRYTLADNFFQAAFGGSFLNHAWLICACTPRHDAPPPEMVAVVDAAGNLVKDGTITPDGYAVNTIFPAGGPYPATVVDKRRLLPPQTMPTIGDRLSEKNIEWAWYSGGWNDAEAGKPHLRFQHHHQAFAFFAKYGPGTPGRARHLKDATDLIADIERGRLPAVAFYKPLGPLNQHPSYTDVLTGDRHVAEILRKIEASPAWSSTVVIVTYDENGGFWDHVAPPVADRWGPGTRIPAIIVSPFAKRGFVDSTVYDTTSILKLIELRFGLEPLGPRDAAANGLLNAFTFGDGLRVGR